MFHPTRAFQLAAAAVVVTGGLLVASCSGGSNVTTPLAQATNAPSSLQAVPTNGGTLSVPAAANGQVATFTFATGVPSGITLTSSSSTTAPGSAPAPSSLVRSTEAISGAVPFLYVTFSFSGSLASSFVTGETASLTSSLPANASYYVEFDDITSSPGTKLGCAGPGTVANLIATISNGQTGGVCTNSGGGSPTLQAGHTYLAQFYYVSGSTSPTPSPSPTATATSGTQAAFPCGSAPPSASGTLTNFAVGTTLQYPALGSCSATITFQTGTTFGVTNSVNVTTTAAVPAGAPSPLPTGPTGTAPKAALLYETLTVTAGSITVPVGTTASPLQTVTIASTGTCSSYGQSFAQSLGGWQGASSGTLNGLTVTFPAGQSTNQTVLNVAGSPYYIGYFCY